MGGKLSRLLGLNRQLSRRRAVWRAYAVHFYTSLGLIAGLAAMIAIVEGRPRDVFIFLWLALWIDSMDGTLARSWEVKFWAPNFDGRKLDDITDYLNYVFIPVFFIYQFGLISRPWSPVLMLILLASAFRFCHSSAKTDDGYFTGFPSYWNVIAFYFYVFQGNRDLNGLILLFFAIMVFVPIKYIYPSQTPVLRWLNQALSVFWFVLVCIFTATLDNPNSTLVYLSLIGLAYYLLASILLHFKPGRESLLDASQTAGD